MRPEVLLFNDRHVEIKRRAFKRSIGITLHVSGKIQITAPKLTSLRRINEFLFANREWIEKNLESYAELRNRYPRKHFTEGEMFPFLGERLKLHYVASRSRRVSARKLDDAIEVAIPQGAWETFNVNEPHPEIAKALIRYYETSARELLQRRIDFHSRQMGLFPKSVMFRAQKTRWGSCSSRGTLSFNWRLVIAPLVVIDYVIVHELAHLKFHNHSKAFWNLVESQIPDYRERRDWLRTHQYEADFLSARSELHV